MRSHLGKKVRKLASDWFDIPQDVALNIPRVTMIGSLQLHVENHRGVEHFSNEQLILRINEGALKIVGKDLKIRSIYTEEVVVEGIITGLSFLTRQGRGGT